MNPKFHIDTSGMDAAMRDLARVGIRAHREVVTMNGQTLIRALAGNTPKKTGMARAGWLPGWRGLDMPGKPFTRHELGQYEGATRRDAGAPYVAEGWFKDGRNDTKDPHVEFANSSHRVWRGKKIYYIYVHNAQGSHAGWMQRAVDEAEFKFGRAHDRLLKKYSA